MPQAGYVPERGDFVWLNLDPRTGHQRAGRRQALVLSPRAFNRKAGWCVICPATSRPKGYPFEVPFPDATDPKTVILVERIRCVDWRARKVRFSQRVLEEVLEKVIGKLEALVIDPVV